MRQGTPEFQEFMRERGRKGGQGSRGYKFGHGKVDPKVIGALGGRKPGFKHSEATKQKLRETWAKKQEREV